MSESKPTRIRWIFLGPEGIRAGWSILLFIVVMVALAVPMALPLRFLPKPHLAPQTLQLEEMILMELFMGVVVLGATWVMARVEKRPLGAFGFGNEKGRLRLFLGGTLWGFVSLSALVLGLRALGLLTFGGVAQGLETALKYAALNGVAFLLVGFSEEYLMRGYLQRTLARGLAGALAWLGLRDRAKPLGFWVAALVLSFLFGLGHKGNPGESPLGLVSAGLAGLLFCLSLWYSGSLWWALGFHMSWDWAMTFFYGTPNSGTAAMGQLFTSHPAGPPLLSGGTTGPEGSLLVLPVLLAVALVTRRLKPERN